MKKILLLATLLSLSACKENDEPDSDFIMPCDYKEAIIGTWILPGVERLTFNKNMTYEITYAFSSDPKYNSHGEYEIRLDSIRMNKKWRWFSIFEKGKGLRIEKDVYIRDLNQ